MKKLFSFLLIVIIGSLSTLASCSGEENVKSTFDIPGETVYGTKSEQDEVYEIIINTEGVKEHLVFEGIQTSVVKGSITPIYVADFFEYAQTGVYEVKRYLTGHTKDEPRDEGGQEYLAKLATDEGVFAGIVYFDVEDGIFHCTGGLLSSAIISTNSHTSPSYADHARRIANLLGRDSFLPAENVRYVMDKNLGFVFYINDNGKEALVVIQAEYWVYPAEDEHWSIITPYRSEEAKKNNEIVYFNDELQERAKEKVELYKEKLERNKEFLENNPGYILSPPSSRYWVNEADVDDIINIEEYLAQGGA